MNTTRKFRIVETYSELFRIEEELGNKWETHGQRDHYYMSYDEANYYLNRLIEDIQIDRENNQIKKIYQTLEV